MFIEKVIEKQADTHNSEILYDKKKSLLKMLKDKEGERDRYTEMYVAGIIKTLKDVEDKVYSVDKQIEELKEELLFIEKGLTVALGEKDNADLIMQTLRAYEHIVNSKHLTIEDKRKITGVFIERVTLNEGTKIEIKLNFSKRSTRRCLTLSMKM